MRRPALLTLLALAAVAAVATPGCNSTPIVAQYDAEADGARTNACLTFGQMAGYSCQSGTTCPSGFVNIQDLSCGTTGQQCCGPLGDGGNDASDDVQVFIDGAVFETGSPDAAVESGPHDAGADAPADARTDSGVDAGMDAGHRDGSASDAASDGTTDGHAPADGSSDAKQG
jgi:hypothetical protein